MSAPEVTSGIFALAGVVVGSILAVLLPNYYASRRRRQERVEQLMLLVKRATESVSVVLDYRALNDAKLSPIAADKLESGPSQTYAEFSKVLNTALEAFPFPLPRTDWVEPETSHGYLLGSWTRQLRDDVVRVNSMASVLRQKDTKERDEVAEFLSAATLLVEPRILISTKREQFKLYVEELWSLSGRKPSPKDKMEIDRQAESFEADAWEVYNSSKNLSKTVVHGTSLVQDFLEKIGWPEHS